LIIIECFIQNICRIYEYRINGITTTAYNDISSSILKLDISRC